MENITKIIQETTTEVIKKTASPALSTAKASFKGILAGGITGCIEVLITYPTEYVKTQLQIDGTGKNQKYNGNIDCVKQTVEQYGIQGLYRGMLILLYVTIPKTAVRFGSFEFFKSIITGGIGYLDVWKTMFCSFMAGLVEAIVVVTPSETIKVKFIHDRRLDEPRYKGFTHGIVMIVKEHGIGGIYKGLIPTVIKQSSNQLIRFTVVHCCEVIYRLAYDLEHGAETPWWLKFPAGGLAGATSVLANNPMDVVKTRMQGLEAEKYSNFLDCCCKIAKNEGFFAFYKGITARMSRVVIDVALTFCLYYLLLKAFALIWPD